ncbi:MAG: rhombosortase [Candidatus Thiodiazotropha sp.]
MRIPSLESRLCPLAVTAVCLVSGLLPPDLVHRLEYNRTAILAGEWWRLVSGHFVHLSGSHLLMNLAALWLIRELFLQRENPLVCCLYRLPLLTIGTALGLLLLSPELAWYRGLSGILHGLLVFALLQQLTRQPGSTALLLTLLAGKLAWEQLAGPLPGSESWTGGRVIVDAHLYGALSGVLLWAAERIYATMIHQEVSG